MGGAPVPARTPAVGVGEPLKGALHSSGIEGSVRLDEPVGITQRVAHTTSTRSRSIASYVKHRRTGVDPHELPVRTEIDGQRQPGGAQPASDVQEPLPGREAQLLAFPRAQLDGCRPRTRRIHRVQKDRDVRVLIDAVEPQCMRVWLLHEHTVGRGVSGRSGPAGGSDRPQITWFSETRRSEKASPSRRFGASANRRSRKCQDSTRATACSSTQAISSSASSKRPRRASSTSHADPRAANSSWCSSIWRARSIPAWTMLRSRSIP